MEISHGSDLSRHLASRNLTHLKRKATASTQEFKKRRIQRRCDRAQLRYRTEKAEGPTYPSHMALFDDLPSYQNCVSECEDNAYLESANVIAVYFDLETGGFDLKQRDILQISAKCGKLMFNAYVTPKLVIDPRASALHGLTSIGKKLYKHGREVFTLSIENALNEFINFLQNHVKKKCILVAQNCKFDDIRLVSVIEKFSLQTKISELVQGFFDTLPLFKKLFPDTTNHKLTTLTQEILNFPTNEAQQTT